MSSGIVRSNPRTADREPNMSAPGVSIRRSTITDAYLSDSGTSYSSPHVAGTVALIWSGRPELTGDIAATRSLLDRAAIDTSDLTCDGDPGNNNVWGEGRLDALDAFEAPVVIFEDGFESGDTSAWSNTVP